MHRAGDTTPTATTDRTYAALSVSDETLSVHSRLEGKIAHVIPREFLVFHNQVDRLLISYRHSETSATSTHSSDSFNAGMMHSMDAIFAASKKCL